jgi:NTP pyrophosphatase (non-canonical NTP hydrolase)
MNNIIEDNYKSTVNRGLINERTTFLDFTDKLQEEVQEFLNYTDYDNFKEELSDIILVCLNIAKHNNIDIEKELIRKIRINIERV